jgi:hypothetical protein
MAALLLAVVLACPPPPPPPPLPPPRAPRPQVLEDQIPTVVEKAVASEGGGAGPRRRATAFGRAFAAHLGKLRAEPGGAASPSSLFSTLPNPLL